jgi:hypothetical protein
MMFCLDVGLIIFGVEPRLTRQFGNWIEYRLNLLSTGNTGYQKTLFYRL